MNAREAAVLAAGVAVRASLLTKAIAIAGCLLAALVGVALLLSIWWAATAGAGSSSCDPGNEVVPLGRGVAPADLRPLFDGAAERYRLGRRGPSVLAALTKIESDFGRNMGPSSAGAIGWTQFMPATWARYGVDANGDGRRDPYTAADAIHAAARYLRASGAPRDWRRALFAYNHADWYVEKVLAQASAFSTATPVRALPDVQQSCVASATTQVGDGADLVRGGGQIVAIPGSPGESIDARILQDVLALQRRYRFTITDGYAPTGHEPAGEHPLGLAVDVVPGPTGTWDDLDALARWAEPRQNGPRAPFRFVGWDGDVGHGRGDHLHLSWDHSPTPSRRPPAAWVRVLRGRAG